MMKKNELRKIYLEKRKRLSSETLQKGSFRISERFFQKFNLNQIRFLHLFLPIKKFNEIDTSPIFEKIWQNFPQIQILIPKVDFQTQEIKHLKFNRDTKLIKNIWQIDEAENSEDIEDQKIDMVLVPLLCFDKKGFRIGYGKGFYDKFLEKCRSDCRKIGLSFFPPLEKISDTDKFDVRLDFCLTPDDFFTF